MVCLSYSCAHKSVVGQSRGCGVSTVGFKYLHPKIATAFQVGDICLQTEVITCTRSCMFCGCFYHS